MSKFVQGVKSLFTGVPDADNSEEIARQEENLKKQREQQTLTLENQKQNLQQQEGEQTTAAGRASRVPRGRRLLLAATGEAGLPSKLGG
jgi:hypothetical protein